MMLDEVLNRVNSGYYGNKLLENFDNDEYSIGVKALKEDLVKVLSEGKGLTESGVGKIFDNAYVNLLPDVSLMGLIMECINYTSIVKEYLEESGVSKTNI